ncbi:hypothetical protein HNQ64_001665 [Prosthecobacter dejongeii]|uniref:Uncharacterized protein n=1 Tax=Prosthecobacter dejongeii TaxID=48465 RepID=A0A7W8DPY2_9BACT|nr:hypothetical protein [Prosthecobacter dejongeii]
MNEACAHAAWRAGIDRWLGVVLLSGMLFKNLVLRLLPCLLLVACAPYTRSTDAKRPASRPGMKGRRDLLQVVDPVGMEMWAVLRRWV